VALQGGAVRMRGDDLDRARRGGRGAARAAGAVRAGCKLYADRRRCVLWSTAAPAGGGAATRAALRGEVQGWSGGAGRRQAQRGAWAARPRRAGGRPRRRRDRRVAGPLTANTRTGGAGGPWDLLV